MKKKGNSLSRALTSQTVLAENSATVSSYNELKRRVQSVFERGRRRIQEEIARTYWQVGKLIDNYLKTKPSGDELDRTTIHRLSVDLKIGRSELFRSLEMVRTYPKVEPARLLSWSHYRELLTVDDNLQREQFAKTAERLGWSRAKLRREIKKLKLRKHPAKSAAILHARPLELPQLGSFHTFRIVGPEKVPSANGQLFIDLGFSVYKEVNFKEAAGWRVGDVVSAVGAGLVPARSTTRATTRVAPTIVKKGSASDLFTYRARVANVVDGDTFLVIVDLGFGMRTRQYLRLRGIDTPEIKTRAGKKAREFVAHELKDSDEITIKSSRSDKYDRYLADVFLKNSVYLNQLLLDRGFATRI